MWTPPPVAAAFVAAGVDPTVVAELAHLRRSGAFAYDVYLSNPGGGRSRALTQDSSVGPRLRRDAAFSG